MNNLYSFEEYLVFPVKILQSSNNDSYAEYVLENSKCTTWISKNDFFLFSTLALSYDD